MGPRWKAMEIARIPSRNVPARHWHLDEGGEVQCELCPRRCRLTDGQRGHCYVRACHKDQLVLTSYGRSSGFCVDPIENKPLNHFLPGSSTLSFGTAGCNLSCLCCPNWDPDRARETDALAARATPEEIAASAVANGCPSIALTYNDPVVYLEYAIDVAAACHARGVRCVALTAGYICAGARAEFFQAMDATKVDLKGFSERFYREVCGGDLETVKETLCYLVGETSLWVEISTLLIPGENDSDEDIVRMSEWIGRTLGTGIPLHITGFQPRFRMSQYPSTPDETLSRARSRALESGLQFVYTDTMEAGPGGITYCAGCAEPLIRREGRSLRALNLDDAGCCPHCGTVCPGVFDQGSRDPDSAPRST